MKRLAAENRILRTQCDDLCQRLASAAGELAQADAVRQENARLRRRLDSIGQNLKCDGVGRGPEAPRRSPSSQTSESSLQHLATSNSSCSSTDHCCHQTLKFDEVVTDSSLTSLQREVQRLLVPSSRVHGSNPPCRDNDIGNEESKIGVERHSPLAMEPEVGLVTDCNPQWVACSAFKRTWSRDCQRGGEAVDGREALVQAQGNKMVEMTPPQKWIELQERELQSLETALSSLEPSAGMGRPSSTGVDDRFATPAHKGAPELQHFLASPKEALTPVPGSDIDSPSSQQWITAANQGYPSGYVTVAISGGITYAVPAGPPVPSLDSSIKVETACQTPKERSPRRCRGRHVDRSFSPRRRPLAADSCTSLSELQHELKRLQEKVVDFGALPGSNAARHSIGGYPVSSSKGARSGRSAGSNWQSIPSNRVPW